MSKRKLWMITWVSPPHWESTCLFLRFSLFRFCEHGQMVLTPLKIGHSNNLEFYKVGWILNCQGYKIKWQLLLLSVRSCLISSIGWNSVGCLVYLITSRWETRWLICVSNTRRDVSSFILYGFLRTKVKLLIEIFFASISALHMRTVLGRFERTPLRMFNSKNLTLRRTLN